MKANFYLSDLVKRLVRRGLTSWFFKGEGWMVDIMRKGGLIGGDHSMDQTDMGGD